MWDLIKKFFKYEETRTRRELVWKKMPEGSKFSYNYWCPYCERWVENALFKDGGEWERKYFHHGGGGGTLYYDTGSCKLCGAFIHVDKKQKAECESL